MLQFLISTFFYYFIILMKGWLSQHFEVPFLSPRKSKNDFFYINFNFINYIKIAFELIN